MPTARFQLNLHDAANLVLRQAILVYHPTGRTSERAYASIHPVELDDGHPVIQAGKPVTARAVLRLARALSSTASHVGYLPEHVLYADGDALVWWAPPQRRHIAFHCANDTLGQHCGVVPHPALVFMVAGGKWLVWAHKGRSRPLPDSPMFQAPYFNVNAEGAICRGNVVTPTGSTLEKIGAWEDAFFRSYFTHPNLPQGLVRHPGGAHAFWRALLDQPPVRFPLRALISTGKSLGELVARQADGNH
jgi:PRTRC genetic system protein B